MTIAKAHWDTEGENVRLSMPFSKVDQERRIVSGFATLDNVDRQADIVTTEASLDAFAKFRGNIREMHQPIAIGKMISFKEDKYFDPETKKFYSGVYVSTYISKGAQDAWEKVLDGTYTGFSIGGRMNKWDDAIDTNSDKAVRIIKDYTLTELSLVDSPANQFASILSVQKNAAGESVVKSDNADVAIENVFWDKESGLVLLSENEVATSPTSGAPMQNIGFVEKSDNEKTDMIKFLVDSAKGISTIEINKEVSPMTDTTNDAVVDAPAEEAVVEDAAVEESQVAPEAETVTEEPAVADADVEKGDVTTTVVSLEEASEPVDNEAEEATEPEDETIAPVAKSDDELNAAIADVKDTVSKAFSDLTDTVKSLYEHVSELSKSLDAVKNEVNATKGEFDNFGKRFEAVEADTAFRKSGDLGEIVQENPQINKSDDSPWGGRFLKTADLFK